MIVLCIGVITFAVIAFAAIYVTKIYNSFITLEERLRNVKVQIKSIKGTDSKQAVPGRD